MPRYRVFAIGDDSHIVGIPHLITCASDDEALEQARDLVAEGILIEIWQDNTLVGHISPNKKAG